MKDVVPTKRNSLLLDDQKIAFVSEYLVNGYDAKQAALKAGYTNGSANMATTNLLPQPAIQKYLTKAIKKSEDKLITKLGLTVEWKANVLKRIIEDIVPLDRETPIKTHYTRTAIAALQELNKMQGDYAPEKKLSVSIDATQERLLEVKRVYEEY